MLCCTTRTTPCQPEPLSHRAYHCAYCYLVNSRFRFFQSFSTLDSLARPDDLLLHQPLGAPEGNEVQVSMIKGYREKIESGLANICGDILDDLDKHLIPSAASSESKVFSQDVSSRVLFPSQC